MPRRKYTHRNWLPEEDEIVDRHARALADGTFRDISDASRGCARDIERLYESPRRADPHHPVATRARPFDSIRHRMMVRLTALGLTWTSRLLTPSEERVVNRHVQELVRGRHRDTRKAAEACVRELSGASKAVGRVGPLSLAVVKRRIYERARRLKQPWGRTRWSARDAQVAERYARAVVRGSYVNAMLAARACQKELRRLDGPARVAGAAGRPLSAVRHRIRELARAMGRQKAPRWTRPERRVVDRYLRALYAGRFRYIRPAAEACANDLNRRFGQGAVRAGSSDGSAGRHSATAVYHTMVHAVMRLGLPRFRGETTPAERRLFEKYARAVSRGGFSDCTEASRACALELGRLNARAGRCSALAAAKLAGRSQPGILSQILLAVGRLNLHIPGGKWQEDENRLLQQWLNWYERHRRVRRLQPLRTASSGLQEELENLGSRRTRMACQQRLLDEYHRHVGLG